MRIIAGKAGGRRLLAPKGHGTRPTPDRVKEALFSILADHVDGAVVLDLFAGTGALGLEALSRGAERAVFVEADRGARAALEKNVALVAPDASSILSMPADRALVHFAKTGQRFDLVFLDPPFDAGLLTSSLAALFAQDLLLPSAFVVCEHRTRDAVPTPPPGGALALSRAYGDVTLSFVTKGSPP